MMLHFLKYMFVLATELLDYMLKLNMKLPAAFILSAIFTRMQDGSI